MGDKKWNQLLEEGLVVGIVGLARGGGGEWGNQKLDRRGVIVSKQWLGGPRSGRRRRIDGHELA